MPLCSRDLDPRERQLLQLFQDHVVFVALEKHRHAYASAALIDKRPRGLMLFISRTLVTAKRNDQTSVASKRCIERSARDENALQAGAELRRLRDERIGRADDDDAIGRVDDELPGRLQEIKGIPRSRCLDPPGQMQLCARLTFSSRYVQMNGHAGGTPSRRPGATDYGDT
jgi:hypothetical protein